MNIDLSQLITPETKAAEQAKAYERSISNAIQKLLDDKARELEYDNIHTACGWAGSIPSATALKSWGVACWAKSTQIRAEVLTGSRSISTVEEVLLEMPAFIPPV